MVLDDSSRGVDLLNGLAARNVLFDVIYEHNLKPNTLSHYSEVALLTADTVSDKSIGVLENYVRNGGRLIVAGQSASLDQQGRKRQRPSFFGRKSGKGECVYMQQVLPLDQLAENLRKHEEAKAPGIEAPAGVVFNVVTQPASHRVIVHLLNYTAAPIGSIKIELKRPYRSATLLSPDLPQELPVTITPRAGPSGQVILPSLKVYALLVLGE